MSNKKQVIFYGAGRYVSDRFKSLSKKYNPICFCDKNARSGQMHVGLDVKPPQECFEYYPNAQYVITIDPVNGGIKRDIQLFLLEKGISRERILNYSEYIWANGCPMIFQGLMFVEGCLAFCCEDKSIYGYEIPKVVIDYDVNTSIQKLDSLRKEVFGALNDKEQNRIPDIACIGCSQAKHDWYDMSLDISLVNICSSGGEDKCNFKCIYCSAGYGGEKRREEERREEERREETGRSLMFLSSILNVAG